MVALVRMARLFHLGIEPAPMREAENTTAEAEAQKVHDALWASGELRAGMTEKEKAIVYYKWMCMNTRYDAASGFFKITTGDRYALSHAAVTVFITGTGVCDGLAKAYLCLLETEGISCRMGVKMPKDGSAGHAWAIAVLDGVEYDPIDLTDYSADPDGSFSQHMFELLVEKFFYPDEYEANLKPLRRQFTDEELQRVQEACLQIDYTLFTDELQEQLYDLVQETPAPQWDEALRQFIDSNGLQYTGIHSGG